MHIPTHGLWTAVTWAAVGAALNSIVYRTSLRPDPLIRPCDRRGVVAISMLVTAVLFGLLAWRLPFGVTLMAVSVLTVAGVRLAVIDFAEYRLPTLLVAPLYPTLLGLLGLATAINGTYPDLLRAVAGMIVLPAGYLAMALFTQGGLGAGDIRLAGPIGLVLAWHSWTAVLAGTLLAFLYATLIAIPMLARDRAISRTPIPFGPAMLAGALTAALLASA